MKQSIIFVLNKCEITVDKLYSEHEVDLHNMRKSKSVTLCPALPYVRIQYSSNSRPNCPDNLLRKWDSEVHI